MSRRNARLYVGNLPPDVRERDIEDVFKKYGRITALDLRNKKGPPFCFLDFDDARDAEDAIRGRDGYDLDGYKMRVEVPRSYRDSDGRFSNPRSDRGGGDRRGDRDRDRYSSRSSNSFNKFSSNIMRRSKYRVLVTGLPLTASWQDLKDHMREAGDVCYADVHKDGTGVVEYLRSDDMKYAIKKLDDTKMRTHEGDSTYIRVKAADDNDRGDRSRDRGRSKSRSRSRSAGSGGGRGRSRSRSPVARNGSPKEEKNGSDRGVKRERSASRSKSRSRERSAERSKSKSPDVKSEGRGSRSPSAE